MNYAIVLAGGVGSRFWPLSTKEEPKQFLRLFSDRPMIEMTIDRISRLIRKGEIYIATNRTYYKKVRTSLSGQGIVTNNIFLEPEARNTFAPIGLLSKKIYSKDNEAIIIVLPCDHYIKDKDRFLKTLGQAIAAAKKGYIVTLGITPNRLETEYGYIKIKSKVSRQSGSQKSQVFQVERFVEKPGLERARGFLKNKEYFWNSGIFIFRADTMLEEIRKFAPGQLRILSKIRDKKTLDKLWPRFNSTSIDYAIMEKSKKIALIPANFGWTDLGSWQAVDLLKKKDGRGNIFIGKCYDIGSKDTLAWSDNRLLATIGLSNIIIVNTKDAILVCAKDRAQDIKRLVRMLKEENFKE
jgi:mannose-1-phosphate guanylyltransferase